MEKSLRILVVAVLALRAARPAMAASVVSAAERESIRGVPDTWGFVLGGFWPVFDTNVRVDGETGHGTDIDFEKDLGLDGRLTTFALGGFCRFSDRSRLDLAYVPWKREHTAAIEKEIRWGDVIYAAAATVTTKAESQALNAIYKYSFLNNGEVTFGLNAGISSFWHTFSLAGEGTIAGGSNVSTRVTERKSVLFPIPVIGLHFEMTLTRRLFWRAEGNFFAANIAGYDGNLKEFSTSLVYFPMKNIGVGGGFNSTISTVRKSGDHNDDIRVRAGFSGVMANLHFLF